MTFKIARENSDTNRHKHCIVAAIILRLISRQLLSHCQTAAEPLQGEGVRRRGGHGSGGRVGGGGGWGEGCNRIWYGRFRPLFFLYHMVVAKSAVPFNLNSSGRMMLRIQKASANTSQKLACTCTFSARVCVASSHITWAGVQGGIICFLMPQRTRLAF